MTGRWLIVDSQTTAIIGLALLGAFTGPFAALLAARRVVAQPIAEDPDAERLALAAVVAEPLRSLIFAHAPGLAAADFAHQGRRDAYAAVCAAFGQGRDLDSVRTALSGNDDALAALETAVSEAAAGLKVSDVREQATKLESVVLGGEDRARYPSNAPVVERLPRDAGAAFERRYQAPTTLRLVFAALCVAVGFGVSGWLAPAAGVGVAGVAALAAAVVVCFVIAAVDHDTLLLDMPVFWAGAAVAWGLTVATALSEGDVGRIWLGLGVGVGWAVVFEMLNAAYKLVRGIDGMGFGDSLIVLISAGVPAAVSGSLLVGFYSVVGGMAVALLVSLPLALRGKRGTVDPFALGPFLGIGWIVAWPAFHLLGAI